MYVLQATIGGLILRTNPILRYLASTFNGDATRN